MIYNEKKCFGLHNLKIRKEKKRIVIFLVYLIYNLFDIKNKKSIKVFI